MTASTFREITARKRHILMGFFTCLQEMKSPCALLFIECGAQEILGKLLSVVQKCLVDLKNSGNHPTTPR